MAARHQLSVGMRVWVASARQIGIVSQLGKVEVALYFPDAFNQGPRVFLWDDGIVPVEPLVEKFLGATYEELGIERRR